MLWLRGKPLALFLSDGSAVVTAWLIALTFPPLAPWWLIVVGTLFAIVVAKHLYGGLGQNPFNPAMVAFAACIVSFPATDVAVAGARPQADPDRAVQASLPVWRRGSTR
jgi:electron transport complex protein RnfD